MEDEIQRLRRELWINGWTAAVREEQYRVTLAACRDALVLARQRLESLQLPQSVEVIDAALARLEGK